MVDSTYEQHRLFVSRHCPRCGHKLSKRDWGGLPAGVKFDPTDQELMEHLEAKVEEEDDELGNKIGHPLIDKFIPTIDGEDGICYTHPENLPGVRMDGLSKHFFHRPSKAYTTGTRKRRKIQGQSSGTVQGETRWHKTGKTRPVMVSGRKKGCKKILVLYTNFGKNRKPEKTSWVMHQYHLGEYEEEKEGELVVSKIFYQTQPRQCNWSSSASVGPGSEGISSGSVCSKEGASIGAYAHHGFEFHHQLNALYPYGFDEAGIGGRRREGGVLPDPMLSMSEALCDSSDQFTQDEQCPQQQQQQQQHQLVNAAFHIHRPTNQLSQIISPSPMHHSSIILADHGSFHDPRIILPNHNFHQQQQQQTQQQQQHHKTVGGSASGLEEIIMSCNSSSSPYLKEMRNTEEADWMKYSTNFWQDTDNQDHHGYKS